MDNENRLKAAQAARSEKKRTAWDVSLRLAIASTLLGACNVRGLVEPVGAKSSESPTPNLPTPPPEHIYTPTRVPTKSAEAKPSNTATTQEAFGTQHARQTADFTPSPTYDQTIVAPELTDTPTLEPTKTETQAPTQDLAAVLDLVEKELHPYVANEGGVVILELKAEVSLAELNIQGKSSIPEKIGGGKVLWDLKVPVGNTFIYPIMARQLSDGSYVQMSQSGLFRESDVTAFVDFVKLAYAQSDNKICTTSMDVGVPGSLDAWERSIKFQPDWRDMFFVSDDGTKIYVLPSLVQCR